MNYLNRVLEIILITMLNVNMHAQTQFEVMDQGFQMQLINSTNPSNNWYIGASNPGWAVGDEKLEFSPTSLSSEAMLILNNEDDVISVRSHRIANVGDPTSERDAVNLRTLKSLVKVTQLSSRVNSLTLGECAMRCKDLIESGHDDWKVPSLDDAIQFLDSNRNSHWIWTTQYGGIDEIRDDLFKTVIIINVATADMNQRIPSEGINCRCVR